MPLVWVMSKVGTDAGNWQLHVLNEFSLSVDKQDGLGLKLPTASILLECARSEIHSTSLVPLSGETSQLGLVFYRHKNLDVDMHTDPCL